MGHIVVRGDTIGIACWLGYMSDPRNDVVVIDYAAAPANDGARFIRLMRTWRTVCAWCFWGGILGSGISQVVGFVAALGAIAAAVVTIIYMGCAARTEVGTGYAVRHVILAALLTPIALLGIWMVPVMVEFDLAKWRAIEDEQLQAPSSDQRDDDANDIADP